MSESLVGSKEATRMRKKLARRLKQKVKIAMLQNGSTNSQELNKASISQESAPASTKEKCIPATSDYTFSVTGANGRSSGVVIIATIYLADPTASNLYCALPVNRELKAATLAYSLSYK